MAMDVIVGVIILLSMFFGVKKGFALTLINCMQWFLSVIVAFLFYGRFQDLLVDKTHIDEVINEKIVTTISGSVTESPTYQSIPHLFSDTLNEISDTFMYRTATTMTDILLSIIAFLLIIIGIKIACFLISRLFSKKYNDGIVGFFDGAFGLGLGLVRGVLLVLIFFAFLVPILGIIFPEFSTFFLDSFETSYIAEMIYNDNILLILMDSLFN
ncbi:MAG: CvpA family protein [Anaerovoracaceae bacterium]